MLGMVPCGHAVLNSQGRAPLSDINPCHRGVTKTGHMQPGEDWEPHAMLLRLRPLGDPSGLPHPEGRVLGMQSLVFLSNIVSKKPFGCLCPACWLSETEKQ